MVRTRVPWYQLVRVNPRKRIASQVNEDFTAKNTTENHNWFLWVPTRLKKCPYNFQKSTKISYWGLLYPWYLWYCIPVWTIPSKGNTKKKKSMAYRYGNTYTSTCAQIQHYLKNGCTRVPWYVRTYVRTYTCTMVLEYTRVQSESCDITLYHLVSTCSQTL